jgi:hypothetical protein
VRDHNGQTLSYVYYENEPGRRSAAKLLVPRPGFETFGEFASSSLSVAIKAFDLFLHVFKYSLTDAARKPRRPQNPTNGAGFQTGTLMTGLKNAPSRAPRHSERRSLLVQCDKSCFNKSYPDFRNLGALSRLQF